MDPTYLVPVAQLMRDVPSSSEVVFSACFDADHEFAPGGPAVTDVAADAPVDVAVTLQSIRGGL
ncbi:MAG: hypothetical protein KGQ78_10820, partial [Acidobacteria bacterium]|nr:hypothetical protein [Acidobacteriota bacterium]